MVHPREEWTKPAENHQVRLAFWSAPALWSFAQAKRRSKAPEGRRTPGRCRVLCDEAFEHTDGAVTSMDIFPREW